MRLKDEILRDAKLLVDRCKELHKTGCNILGGGNKSPAALEHFEIMTASLIKDAEVVLSELGEIKPHCGWWYKKVVHSWIVSILQQMEILIEMRLSILLHIGMLNEDNRLSPEMGG